MLLECNQCVQLCFTLQEYAIAVNAPNPYQVIIHSNEHLASQNACLINGPQEYVIGFIIPGTEDGIIGRQNIIIRRREELNTNGLERFDTTSVTHRSYDLLCIVLLLPH